MADRLKATLAHLAPNDTSSAAVSVASSYKYTVDSGLLSHQERDFYEENGFLLVKGLLPDKDAATYRKRFVDLCNRDVPAPPFLTLMRDVTIAKKASRDEAIGEAMIAKIQDFEDEEVLFQYCKHPEILKYVKCFTGPDVKSVHTMLINKPPNAGVTSRHPLHQDLHYFPFRPAERIVAAWTALERCSILNGCLQVLPGTHKGELLEHGYPTYEEGIVNVAYHEIKGLNQFGRSPRVNLEMEPGDTVFFHPILIHGSGPNNSQGYRKAISCHYASSHCDYIEVSGTTHETMVKEFAELRERRFPGLEISYVDFWKFKARLVAGNEGTL